MKKLNEIFTSTEGIFSTFETLYPDEYSTFYGDIETTDLDFQVYYQYGERIAAPILENNATNYIQPIRLILSIHMTQWERVYEALTAKYDVLNNYNYKETKTGTDTTENKNNNSSIDSEKSFNSTEMVDNNQSTNESSGKNTVTYNTTVTKEGNLGTFPAPDLVLKELEVAKSNFFDIVMNDIIHDLTLTIY